MNPISATLAPYTIWIKAGAVLVVAGVIGWQHNRIETLEADATLYRAATAGYAQAQTVNLDTIDNLRDSLRDVIEVNRMTEAMAASAANAAASEAHTINLKLAATEKELADVYANNANARAWGNTGVDAAVLARLPKPAASRADQDRREAGAGAGAAAADAGAH